MAVVNLDQEAIWAELETGIRETYTAENRMSSQRFMELYSHVYNYCTNTTAAANAPLAGGQARGRNGRVGRRRGDISTDRRLDVGFLGHSLYNKIQDFLRAYLNNLSKDGVELMGEDLLTFYRAQWERFTFSSKVLNGFCAYVNRHWVRREADEGHDIICQIYNCCLHVWKETIFAELSTKVTPALLALIEQERNGQIITAGLVKSVVQSYVDLSAVGQNTRPLSTYKISFEKQLLEETEIYYTKESTEFISSDKPVTDYMKKVEQRLNEEAQRVAVHFHESTLPLLNRTCESMMIERHLDTLNQEFKKLLSESKMEDLARMYFLVSKLDDKLGNMREHFETHVISQGCDALTAVVDVAKNDPKLYIRTILGVHKKFLDLLDTSMSSDTEFVAALDRACGKFINDNAVTRAVNTSQKSPELLARYCDILMKRKTTEETDTEEVLNSIMIVFKYIEDKDVFQKFYSKMLANRLVSQLSSSDETETAMISKLRGASGFEYTSKLNRMFQDIAVSKDINTDFKQWLTTQQENAVAAAAAPDAAPGPSAAANPSPILDMDILVLTSGTWPFPESPSFHVPEELTNGVTKFTEYYNGKHTGRKLSWLYNRSKGDVLTSCFKKPYTFQASVMQMSVLLMYNSQEQYRVKEIADATDIKMDVLTQVLLVLTRIKILTLPENEQDGGFKDDSVLTLNKDFKNKKIRVIINQPLRVEARAEDDNTRTVVEECRKFECQAAIVRVMKARQKLTHNALVSEVIIVLAARFKPSVPLIKKTIDLLIVKDYMRREEANPDTYLYVA